MSPLRGQTTRLSNNTKTPEDILHEEASLWTDTFTAKSSNQMSGGHPFLPYRPHVALTCAHAAEAVRRNQKELWIT
jgi:hypothetical protein